MQTVNRKIVVTPDMEVSSVWKASRQYRSKRHKGVILAHGAGNDMENPFISHVHQTLAEQELLTVKFNFPYKEQRRKAPDRTPVLEANLACRRRSRENRSWARSEAIIFRR